jgi:outer membrane biosynthesis protein TonB
MNAEIKIKFNPGNAKHVTALNSLISAVGETSQAVAETTDVVVKPAEAVELVVEKEATPKPKQKAKPKAKKPEPEPEPEEEYEQEQEQEEEQEEEEEQEQKSSVTVDAIRALVTKKAKASKKEIKAMLSELGADNVTLLKKDKYEEFHAFLLDL